MVDAYVDWREECVGVWEAYERWSGAPAPDRWFAFSAYRATLEREEHASQIYADLVTRVAAAAQRPTGIAGALLGALRIVGGTSPTAANVVGPAD